MEDLAFEWSPEGIIKFDYTEMGKNIPSRASSLSRKQDMNWDPDHERVRVRFLHFILPGTKDTERRSLSKEKMLSELQMKGQYDGNYRMQFVSLL